MARSWLVTIAIALAAFAASLLPAVPDAGAVLVCQSKKKTDLAVLRADRCKKKENVALDLSNVLDMQASAAADQSTRLTSAQVDYGITCPGDPTRTLVESKFSRGTTTGAIQERPGGGCRTLDGNQASCVKAFQNNDPFADRREWRASSCLYHKGLCLPCTDSVTRRGGCVNTCIGAAPTCADPTRTVFLGGPSGDVCQDPKTQVDCEKSWHLGRLSPGHPSASCYWTGTACRGCGPRHANQGDCTNTCDTTPHPTCKDAARTTFVGGPRADTAHTCKNFNGNQAMCEVSYHVTGEGTAATCWYDTAGAQCLGCGLRWELIGKCNNTCL